MALFLKRMEEFYERYERRIGSVALLFGFIFDAFTLQRIDLLYENMVMFSYLVIAGGGIIALNYLGERPERGAFLAKAEQYLPLLIQFAFGGLFSAFFIFYSRSAAFSSSWPFLLALIFLLVGNEFFKERYRRLVFQVSIYFVAAFSFAIFFVPILVDAIGVWVFILSGAVSLAFMFLFSELLFRTVPKKYLENRKNLLYSISVIFAAVNILYFTNLIPPIPLSLKDAGIYYQVERRGADYVALTKEDVWYEKLLFFRPEIVQWEQGTPLYAFSAVFAPTNIATNVVHHWQYYDEQGGGWTSAGRIPFSIAGGRDGGYRGFSVKQNLFEGKWRVDVETPRGQIIGRIRFDVERSSVVPEIVQEVL